jgi:hypothetical protein
MFSFDIAMSRRLSITANWRPTRQRQFFATAPVPIATIRLFAACVLVRSSHSKRAGRDSIAAQKTFQIVHFLAGTGGLAEPAAEFL